MSENAVLRGSLGETVRSAWPHGVDAEGEAMLARLGPDERRVAEHRLKSLLEVEEGARPASRAPTDDPRGITNSGFQSLVRRWRQDRHPRTLLPYAGRAKRQRGDTEAHSRLERELDRLLTEPGSWSLVALTRAALARTGAGLALNTARLVARERRAALRADPAWLASHYGTELLSDVCALGVDCVEHGVEGPAVIAATVEVASGLVLGYAVGQAGDSLQLQRSALAGGLSTLIGRRLDVQRSEASAMTVVIGNGDAASVGAAAATVRRGAPDAKVAAGDRRRIGDRLADALDGQIDALRLHPRGGSPRRVGSRGTPWTAKHLSAVAEEAVTAHNSARLERLETAPIGPRTGMGAMVMALRPLVGSFGS